MGCIQSSNTAGGKGKEDSVVGKEETAASRPFNKMESQKAAPHGDMPSYMTADPDLGWRNITESRDFYPTTGFEVDFQNERSGNVLKKLNLLVLSVNIADRASKLATRYGVTDSEGLHSSSNLLEDLARHQQRLEQHEENIWGSDIDKDMKKVLKAFGCPHFGWKLLSRRFATAPLIKQYPKLFLSVEVPPAGESNEEVETVQARQRRAVLNELASVPGYLQELRDGDGKRYLLDVSEIAINIAEQLFRLEKSENIGHRIPNDSFGWKVLGTGALSITPAGGQPREAFATPVATPEGEALMVIPEELIMHVASWVQQTYLTAPAF